MNHKSRFSPEAVGRPFSSPVSCGVGPNGYEAGPVTRSLSPRQRRERPADALIGRGIAP